MDLMALFLDHAPIDGVHFGHNDCVRVLGGQYAGQVGSLITLVSLQPEPAFVVELESGGDVVVAQSNLKAFGDRKVEVVEQHTSPDGTLVLIVVQGMSDGDPAVGFEGTAWHMHASSIAQWLEVAENQAVSNFVEGVLSDAIPIITSIDGGATVSPWISDNLEATLRYEGQQNCVMRYWSGAVRPSEG